MRRNTTSYIVLFAGAVCVVCSLLVSSSATVLKDRQDRNALLDKQKNVLAVSGLVEPGADTSPEQVTRFFEERIRTVVIDMQTQEIVPESVLPPGYDPMRAQNSPALSIPAPPNRAQVNRLARYALIYEVLDESGEVEATVYPVHGAGLWSTMYGFIALEADGNTVRGLTFYQDGETPGLGGEINNPVWKAKWDGRRVYNEEGEVAVQVIKGVAPPVADAPFRVDGLSGATITSNGVTYMLQFWLGEAVFGPFIGGEDAGSVA